MCIERAHAAACMLQAAVKLLLLLLKGSWVAELEVQLVRWRCRVSVETYLVNMSAGLSFAWILMILTMSCEISCCMNRCLMSMCFAFLDEPILVAMLFHLKSLCGS